MQVTIEISNNLVESLQERALSFIDRELTSAEIIRFFQDQLNDYLDYECFEDVSEYQERAIANYLIEEFSEVA